MSLYDFFKKKKESLYDAGTQNLYSGERYFTIHVPAFSRGAETHALSVQPNQDVHFAISRRFSGEMFDGT